MLGDVYGRRTDAQMRSISNKLISFASPERFVEFRTRFPVLVQIICQPKTVIWKRTEIVEITELRQLFKTHHDGREGSGKQVTIRCQEMTVYFSLVIDRESVSTSIVWGMCALSFCVAHVLSHVSWELFIFTSLVGHVCQRSGPLEDNVVWKHGEHLASNDSPCPSL